MVRCFRVFQLAILILAVKAPILYDFDDESRVVLSAGVDAHKRPINTSRGIPIAQLRVLQRCGVTESARVLCIVVRVPAAVAVASTA